MFFLKELPSQDMLQAYQDRFPEMNAAVVGEALQMLRRASILIRKLDAYFARHGMSQLRFLILIVIDREPARGGLTSTEILQRLDVSKPVLSRTLQALEADDLIATAPHGIDKRSRLVRLTTEGRERLHALLPGYYELIEDFMRDDAASNRAAASPEQEMK